MPFMPRPVALLAIVIVVPLLIAADPSPVEKQLGLQKAMVAARESLEANRPAEAVATLETAIADADGNKAFLALLRDSYLAELAVLEKAPTPDAARLAQVRRHLALLGGTAPAPQAPALPPPALDVGSPAPAGTDSVTDATAEFKKRNFAAAMRLFAANASSLTS